MVLLHLERNLIMNAKIKELISQCEIVKYDFEGCLVEAGFDAEKFAELIVEECIGICEQAIQQSQHTRDLLQEDELAEKMVIHGSIAQAEKLVQGIKQHFGVEL